MCGIAGFINNYNAPAEKTSLQSMTDAIAHRGPDDEGHWLENNVAIGHRRLAIIDPSPAGHQPMMTEDKRFVLSYNGEIYNFKELRTHLKSKGYQFQSQSDSEVVLQALSCWGAEAFSKFNGMFAIAFWDRQTNTLLLARDRYGIKPLYYADNDQQFAFGSEQKAIWAMPEFTSRIDHEALLEYFTFQNIFSDKTFEKGIKLLPAGTILEARYTGKQVETHSRQYWDFDFSQTEFEGSEQDFIDELDGLMTNAVKRQLVSDVELGSYLSGGIDSGSISGIAAKHIPYMKTFTCGFDLSSASGLELTFDERQKSEFLSYVFKTEHYEMVLKSGDMERCMQQLVWHLEEPRVGQSYPNLYASKLASKFVKVVLSGTGGDELFGGYPWRYYRAAGCTSFKEYATSYYQFWQRLMPNADIKKAFEPIWSKVKHVWTADIFENVFLTKSKTLTRPEDFINHSLYFESKTFLHGLLMVEDKLSMAHSLESRVPFLDNDLVDFAMRCPIRFKLNNLDAVIRLNENDPGNKLASYYQKNRDGKQILRKAMKKHLPEQVSEDIKQGFSAPDASWFKGESIEYVKDTLLNNNARIYQYLDTNTIFGLINEHLTGSENRRLLIWSLLYFENYLNKETYLQ